MMVDGFPVQCGDKLTYKPCTGCGGWAGYNDTDRSRIYGSFTPLGRSCRCATPIHEEPKQNGIWKVTTPC